MTDEAVNPMVNTRIREISTENVWHWLSAGWQDFLRAPMLSLFYGFSLALLSAAVSAMVIRSETYFLLPLLLAGFLLIAPFLGLGPFSASRQLERGESPGLKDAFRAFSANGSQILFMGIILMLCFLGWIMVAILISVFFYPGLSPADWQGFDVMLIGNWDGVQFLIAGTYAGGMIALIVYAISAITVPMLVDRPVNVLYAINTSWNAVRRNMLPMLLWAAILISIILSGFMTLYIGLIIGYPLAAHASWHAYRDLVEHEPRGLS